MTNPIIMHINSYNFYRISVTFAFKMLITQLRCNVVKNYGRYTRFIIGRNVYNFATNVVCSLKAVTYAKNSRKKNFNSILNNFLPAESNLLDHYKRFNHLEETYFVSDTGKR